MIEKVFCEKCGNEMTPFISDSSSGMECKKCGWGWVTTYQEPIKLDDTDYSLQIEPDRTPSVDSIRCIAQILACNFLEARKRIQAGICIEEKAVTVRKIAAELRKNKISYIIKPDFPYEIL